MKLLKYLLPFAMATCGFVASVHAQNDYSTTTEERETDIKALSDFIKQKGGISLQEKGGNLMLSGDVRGEWDHIRTWTRGKSNRGMKSANRHRSIQYPVPFPSNEFNVEVNLMFDYRADRSWAKIQFQFDNPAGIRERGPHAVKEFSNHKQTMFGSGKLSNIAMRKAYLGYNVLEMGTSRFDVEIGRRRLYDVYDSKIQFHNYFDGVTANFAHSLEGLTDINAKTSVFVVDHAVNHFGYVGEIDFLNIADVGVDFKYSYIHWEKRGINRYKHKHPHGNRFQISQFTGVYNLSPELLRFKSQVYGAFLVNHSAHPNRFSNHKRAEKGWYTGFRMGELKRQNDWAIDANYQWVQANAIPESDVRGIGRDNPRNVSFYKISDAGFANYKGYALTGLYNLTDNITLEAYFARIQQASRAIGGKHKTYNAELAAIYAF